MNPSNTSVHFLTQRLKASSLLLALLCTTLFSACKKDEPAPVAQPTIDKIEIGLGNNGIGVIGKDFHLNAEVLAGDRIETVQIKMQQRAGETYTKPWQHEITWDQYKGAKNATVHKHFTIPAEAAEGKYDFLIIVRDQNGATLEEKRSLTLYQEVNLPVNPQLAVFNVFVKGEPFYRNGNFLNPGKKIQKGDTINSQVTFTGVKGDGKMYVLLINKKLNHRPESLAQIDWSKVIVYDVLEHRNLVPTEDGFSNVEFDATTFTFVRDMPHLKIGAAQDNNLPTPNAISGVKAWESGPYYFAVLYQNTTYNMGFFKYIELPIEHN